MEFNTPLLLSGQKSPATSDKVKESKEGFMELTGRVLWWSKRDENGIIVDALGNEFYFDRSVLKLRPNQIIKRKSIVTFNLNKSIKDCLCARDVKVPTVSKKKSIEKKFDKEYQRHLPKTDLRA